MKQLNPAWLENINRALTDDIANNRVFTRTLSEPIGKTALVNLLVSRKIPFVMKNMGAGVALFTTDTKTCPFCGHTKDN